MKKNFDFMQDGFNSIVNALELSQAYVKPPK